MDAERLKAAHEAFDALTEQEMDVLLDRAAGWKGPGLEQDEWLVVALIALDQVGGEIRVAGKP